MEANKFEVAYSRSNKKLSDTCHIERLNFKTPFPYNIKRTSIYKHQSLHQSLTNFLSSAAIQGLIQGRLIRSIALAFAIK